MTLIKSLRNSLRKSPEKKRVKRLEKILMRREGKRRSQMLSLEEQRHPKMSEYQADGVREHLRQYNPTDPFIQSISSRIYSL